MIFSDTRDVIPIRDAPSAAFYLIIRVSSSMMVTKTNMPGKSNDRNCRMCKKDLECAKKTQKKPKNTPYNTAKKSEKQPIKYGTKKTSSKKMM